MLCNKQTLLPFHTNLRNGSNNTILQLKPFLEMHFEPFFRPSQSALERLAHFGRGHVGSAPEPVRRPLVVVPDFDGYSQGGEDREDGRFVAIEREIFCETTNGGQRASMAGVCGSFERATRAGLAFGTDEHEWLGNVLPRSRARSPGVEAHASIEWAVPFRKQDAESAAEAVPAGGRRGDSA